MPSISIKGKIFTSLVDFTIRAGEQVLVVNDVIIGKHETSSEPKVVLHNELSPRRGGADSWEDSSQLSPISELPQDPIDELQYTYAKPKPIHLMRQPTTKEAHILELLGDSAVNVRDFGDFLEIPRASTAKRQALGHQMRQMSSAGFLVNIAKNPIDSRATKPMPIYRRSKALPPFKSSSPNG